MRNRNVKVYKPHLMEKTIFSTKNNRSHHASDQIQNHLQFKKLCITVKTIPSAKRGSEKKFINNKLIYLNERQSEERNKKIHLNLADNLIKANTIQNFEDPQRPLEKNFKFYEILLTKLCKYLKTKATQDIYANVKIFLREEVQKLSNDSYNIRKEESCSSIFEVINQESYNSRKKHISISIRRNDSDSNSNNKNNTSTKEASKAIIPLPKQKSKKSNSLHSHNFSKPPLSSKNLSKYLHRNSYSKSSLIKLTQVDHRAKINSSTLTHTKANLNRSVQMRSQDSKILSISSVEFNTIQNKFPPKTHDNLLERKGGEMLQEIQINLEDNLKGIFNFSYEGFLNKDESESEGQYSTKKSVASEYEIGHGTNHEDLPLKIL